MIKVITILLLFFSTSCFAETEMDRQLKIMGLVDSNYKVTDEAEYIKFWRNVSKETVKNLPIHLSDESRIVMMGISPDLYFMTMELDVEEDTLEIEQRYLNASKSNFCKSNYGKSKVIRANGGMTVAIMVVNKYYENILDYRFSSLECPISE
ncbi:hypothetical protein [Acinetobacter rudis]|nr:hypothetical protein [Acinetobacter rudis]